MLKPNRMVLMLILFLAGVNLVASAFDAVLPAFILPERIAENQSWELLLLLPE